MKQAGVSSTDQSGGKRRAALIKGNCIASSMCFKNVHNQPRRPSRSKRVQIKAASRNGSTEARKISAAVIVVALKGPAAVVPISANPKRDSLSGRARRCPL